MIRDAVARYATRFHRLLGGTHGVASPFGAWLLLALIAPVARGASRAALTDVLGCDPDEAFAAATRMLKQPHAEVVLGAAVWHHPDYGTQPLLEFLRGLAAHADTGPVPSQADADAWARERTLGLIEKFPLEIDASVVLLLATAIATKVSWYLPFLLAPAESALLPAASAFAGKPLLRDPGARAWGGFRQSTAGLLAGYAAPSADGLNVMSVVGDPGADPVAVLDAAQQLVITRPEPVSLFDLPLGDGPAWRITEATASFTGSPERCEFLLPAWQASSDHALVGADFGFVEAGDALIELLPAGGYQVEARQSAMARYTREGFEAAAVTGMATGTSASMPRAGLVRTARVEFTRPHAVVAATRGAGDWDGLPVFCAWVAEAVPAV